MEKNKEKKHTHKKKNTIHQRKNLAHLKPSSPLFIIVVPSLQTQL